MDGEEAHRTIELRTKLRKAARRVGDQIRRADGMLARHVATTPPAPDRTETGDELLKAAWREADLGAAQAEACADQMDFIARLTSELRSARAARVRLVFELVVVAAVVAAIVWLVVRVTS